jgi:hypothetical protein
MSIEPAQRSATIYQFPVGGRKAISAEASRPSGEAAPSRIATVSGGAWYHDAAIQESKLAGER